MVWFPGVSGFGFRGVSGVCFGVAQDGVLLGGGFGVFGFVFCFGLCARGVGVFGAVRVFCGVQELDGLDADAR